MDSLWRGTIYGKVWLTYSALADIQGGGWMRGMLFYVQMGNCTVEDNFVLWTWIKMYRTVSIPIHFILIVYLKAFLQWSLITRQIYFITFQKITAHVKIRCKADRGSITDTYINFFVHKHVCIQPSCPPGSSYIFITGIWMFLSECMIFTALAHC